MKIENREQLDVFLKAKEELYDKVAKIATLMLRLEDKKCTVRPESDEITIEDYGFDIECSESIGCGEYNTYYVTVPFAYLFDENFEEKAKAEILEKKRKAKEAKEKSIEKQRARIRERERKEYARLKEKYGNEND